MKKRLAAVTVTLFTMLSFFSGCEPKEQSPPDSSTDNEPVNKAQLVLALNPILTFDDGSNAIAYNDIKNAMTSDRETASLASMYNDTDWQWTYRQGADWKKRATYSLAKWKNGMGTSPQNVLDAYTFIDDGTISMMSYATQAMDVTAYPGNTVPDVGILLSVSGGEEEALCYTVGTSGKMTIPAGTVTAVQSVAGVETGSLAEDGTVRRAAVRITVNSREIWSGQLANSTAAEDGIAVTSLSYPDFADIPVSAGDVVFISATLDAVVDTPADVTPPSDNSDVSDMPPDVLEPDTPGTSPESPDSTPEPPAESSDPSEETPKAIPLLDGFDSRFTIIRSENASNEMMKEISTLRTGMEKALNTEQIYKTDESKDTGDYEILIGQTNRAASDGPMQEIKNARTNHAADFIIRLVGKKLVFAAANEYSMSLAIDYFLNTYCKDDKGEIPSNLNYVSRPAMKTIMLGDNNIASFTLKTEKYPSYMTVLAAQDLQRQIMIQTGYQIPIETDVEKAAYEIAVGPTSAAKDAYHKNVLADQNAYRISMNGSRLSIEGGSTYAANEGVQALIDELQTRDSFPDGYVKTGTHNIGDYSLSGGYGLTWNDEFNSDRMTKKWFVSTDTTQSFDGSPQIRNGVFGEDYFLRDGCLVEVTRKNLEGAGYHAVRLTTQNLMSFRYGYLELRLSMATKNGAASAIWMAGDGLNQADMPEIDINENFSIDGYWPNLHSWPQNGDGEHIQFLPGREEAGPPVSPAEGEHFYDTFHYLGMEWTEDYIAFYLDGQITLMVDMTSPLYDTFEQSVVLKLANGVSFPGYGLIRPDECLDDVNDFYEEQIIDFVRIYQKDDGVSRLRAKG